MLKRFKGWWHHPALPTGPQRWWCREQQIVMRPSVVNDIVAFEVIEQQLYLTPPWGGQGFRAYFQSRHHHWFTLTANQAVIGYVGVAINQHQRDMHITNIGITPAYQGHGIGTRCIQELQQIARQADLLTMSLEVKRDNERAINLYQTLQFELLRVRRHYYQDDGADAWEMVAQLAPN